LFVVLGVVQRCLFFAWCYLALLGFVDVARLAWHCLALLGTAWHCLVLFSLLRVAYLAWPCRLSMLVALVRFCSLTRFPFSACPVGDGVGRDRGGPFFYHFFDHVFFGFRLILGVLLAPIFELLGIIFRYFSGIDFLLKC
jgi:hypothetical protein